MLLGGCFVASFSDQLEVNMTQLRAKEKAQLRDSTWWQMMVHVTVSVFRVVNFLKLLLTSPCGKLENLTYN